jgi:hypothetical protein
LTGFKVAELHLLLGAKHRFTEADGEFQTQIISFAGTTAALTASTHATAAEATEKGLKQIGKAPHISHVGHATTAKARLTKLVVAGPRLGITQHFIGAANLFEAFFGPAVFIDIGMVLASQASVGTLQGVGIGVTANTQQVVIVSHQPACSCSEAC